MSNLIVNIETFFNHDKLTDYHFNRGYVTGHGYGYGHDYDDNDDYCYCYENGNGFGCGNGFGYGMINGKSRYDD